MERQTKSEKEFNRERINDKMDKLQNDMDTLKMMIVELQNYIIKIDKKVPLRSAGWLVGEYKTYED
tara:strand:+ start:1047 stop:1244 length:198 start_codon:yes stop_codon:yes gene_type:complete